MSLSLRTYGEGGAFLGTLEGVEACEISANTRGPDVGRIVMSREAIRDQRELIRPGHRGALVTVDARELPIGSGVPEIWFGGFETAETSTESPSGSLPLRGPELWLATESAGVGTVPGGSPYSVLASVLPLHPTDLRLVLSSQAHRGAGAAVPLELVGQSVWTMFDDLEDTRGVWIRIRPSFLGALAYVDIGDPGTPVHSGVTLHEGYNFECDFVQDLHAAPAQLTIVARSFLAAGGIVAASAQLPAAAWRPEAYAAAIQVATPAHVAAGGIVEVALEAGSRAFLDSVIATRARELVALAAYPTVRITDPSLWSAIVPGVLVNLRCESDPFGDFARAIALVEECSWSVTPPYQMSASLVAWPEGY